MLTKQRKAARALLRPLKQPLYDTMQLTAATNYSQVPFFQVPQSGNIVAAGAQKSEVDTNLLNASMIGRPQDFDLWGFTCELDTSLAVAETRMADMLLLFRGMFEFNFGQQNPWYRVPLQQIPNGCGTEGTIGTADDAAAVNYGDFHNGIASSKEFYNVTINKNPIPILYAETFYAALRWPVAPVNLANTFRIRVFMKGVLYTGI